MENIKRINAPLTDEIVRDLKAGDNVLLNGVVYTGRDAAHKRFIEALEKGEELPFDIKGAVVYYVGPAPAKPGQPIGSAGPTTSYRMDAYTPKLLEIGLKGMIGKGPRGEKVIEAMKRHGAVYFAAVGGAAALIAKAVKEAEVVAYDDLGPEAVRRLVVEDLPLVVAIDTYGNNLYEEGPEKYRRT